MVQPAGGGGQDIGMMQPVPKMIAVNSTRLTLLSKNL